MPNPTTPTPAGTPSNTAIAADATDLNNRWPTSRGRRRSRRRGATAAGDPLVTPGATDHDVREAALLLLSLSEETGGWIDSGLILCRPAGSLSRLAFTVCVEEGWIRDSWLTAKGREAVRLFHAGEEVPS